MDDGKKLPDALREVIENLHEDAPKRPDPPMKIPGMGAWMQMMREKPSLTLAEARKMKTDHGPLLACGWSHSSSGMMMNSRKSETATIEWAADGSAVLRIEKKEGNGARETGVYRVDEKVSAAILALIERENLAAWEYLAYDPSREPQILDFSSSSNLFLRFDESGSGLKWPVSVTVGTGQADQNGGGKILSEFHDLVYRCRTPENLLSEEKTPGKKPDPFGPVMTPPAAGTWKCAVCGAEGNPGKFCSNCGSPRYWVCPECGFEKNEGKFCTECGRKRNP